MHEHGLQAAVLFLGEQGFRTVAGLPGFRTHINEQIQVGVGSLCVHATSRTRLGFAEKDKPDMLTDPMF